MDLLELSAKRYSLRQFDSATVEKEKLERLLEAGKLAPTAVDYQPQRILVVSQKEGLSALKRCTPYVFNAPVVLVICYDRAESWKNPYCGRDYGAVDVSIVTTHIMLAAAELGLGTTFVGYFDPKVLEEELSIPDFLEPIALLPLGYPAANAIPAHKHSIRKPLSDTVYYESFEGLEPAEAPEPH